MDVQLAAAFGRLCVETMKQNIIIVLLTAAAFGRLCVETFWLGFVLLVLAAAAFGRLCVETKVMFTFSVAAASSRLRAAVC